MADIPDILAMPISELRQRIEAELRENPVLDFQESPTSRDAADAPVVGVLRPLTIFREPDEPPGGEVEETTPDLVAIRSQDGVWEARVPADETRNIVISRRMSDLHRDPAVAKPTREFLARKLGNAKQLLKAMERRREIIEKLGSAILRRQQAFHEHGLHRIVPLKLELLADEIGVDRSTLQLALREKQIGTPHGVVPLDWFVARP